VNQQPTYNLATFICVIFGLILVCSTFTHLFDPHSTQSENISLIALLQDDVETATGTFEAIDELHSHSFQLYATDFIGFVKPVLSPALLRQNYIVPTPPPWGSA
jgi:hypothetical protein